MRPEDLEQVRGLELFASMEADSFENLVRSAYLQRFPPGVQLITEGEPADFLHVVIDGSVELFASTADRETTMAMVYPVSTFILAAAVMDRPYLMSGRTKQKSRILLLPAEDMRAAFRRDPAFAQAIVVELAGCYRAVVKALKGHKLRTSVERVANYLVRQKQRNGADGRLTLPLEKRSLASMLGMTPENLSRAFSQLRRYGVEIDGPEVTFHDFDKLVELARPDPLIDDPAS
jgi:CRP/FNR family transcriptional activator FtrB